MPTCMDERNRIMVTKYEPQPLDLFFQITKNVFSNFNDVKTILDVGSLHALEAVQFSKHFANANIYSFEANPESYAVCAENTKNISQIKVFNTAINDYDGECSFYPTDKNKTQTTWFDGNRGASSLYKSNGNYNHIEKYVQNEIKVPCTRLDSWAKTNGIDQIDILWMDLQGAELKALNSLGLFLDSVKVIHTELEINPMYEDQCLFKDVYPFLTEKGFKLVHGNVYATFGTDFIFIKV